jgi:hypothetical protein
MANNTSYYYDFHYPMPFVKLIMELLGRDPDDVERTMAATADREWFSRPRNSRDTTTEVITTTFRLPLSVSEISVDVLRMPCRMEVWYQDRSNNWRPVLDSERNPLGAVVGRSDTKSWYKYSAVCYPIVAKQVQIRLTRTADPALANTPYPVGLRNTLIRRNVYDRAAGGRRFEDEVDVMGNVIAKDVKDWEATKAIDDDYTTYWRSEPQPDPAAVVSLYLDVRTDTGAPQVIDRLYLDPVYTGQQLNLYYSSDLTVGTRKLSPITLLPSEQLNTEWRPGVGRRDIAKGNAESYYQWPLKIGPQSSQAAWIGVEWTPDFDSLTANLALNPVLFAMTEPVADGYKPTLDYDPGTRRFRLKFDTASGTRLYTTPPMIKDWVAGETVRVIAGWRYSPERTLAITVTNQQGQVLTSLVATPGDLPTRVVLTGDAEFRNVRGAIKNVVVNLESYDISSADFLANPTYYCDPDPVIPDSTGKRPSTSLDNAVYAASFLSREHGTGGPDESHYADKEWTPIWQDYSATKGMLYLPQPTSMKFLKLEFSNLTEEPYPIYESGIQVRYKVFPISVIEQSSNGRRKYTGKGGFLGLGTFISLNGTRTVNFLNPASVLQAVAGIFGTKTAPVVISAGTPYFSDVMPNSSTTLIEDSRRLEVASSHVYARDALQPYVLAADKYNTVIKAEGLQAIQDYVTVPWREIETANPGTITKVKSTGTVALRGTDWWIYPGQSLKIPAAVMTKLTDTKTVTERKFTVETRTRFVTTSVHRYDTRTVKRDAAIAYFAGVREVQPYTSSYIAGEDKPVFEFPIYDPAQWSYDNIAQAEDKLGDPFGPVGVDVPGAPAMASKSVQTQSDFAKVDVDYRDSGLLKSDGMWARADVGWTASTTLAASMNGLTLPQSVIEVDDVGDFPGSTIETTRVASIKTSNGWEEITWTGKTPTALTGVTGGTGTLTTGGAVRGSVADTSVSGSEQLTPYFSVIPGYLDGGRATGGTTSTLTDSTKSWRTNVFAGKMLAVTNGTNRDKFFTVVSNTATTVTISGTAPVAFDSTSFYEVRGVALGNWADNISSWADPTTYWGSASGVFSVSVSNDRRYKGKRVLTFTRAGDVSPSLSGGGEAGIVIRERTNFVPGALARVGATFYRPENTEVLMDSGTATGGTTTTLVDSTKSWAVNAFRGRRLVIESGGGVGQIALITSNTATTLTVETMPVAASSTSVYRIIDGNVYRLRVRRYADAVEVYKEDFTPVAGRWNDYTSNFFEIPATLSDGGFSLPGSSQYALGRFWSGAGQQGGSAAWTRDPVTGRTVERNATTGQTSTGSAKVTTDGNTSSLTSEKMLVILDEVVRCSAWVRWSGLAATSPTAPAIAVYAVYYSDETEIATHLLEGGVVTNPSGSQAEWLPIGGELLVPSGLGVTHVAFRVVVSNVASGGTVWIDDMIADVPGSSRQTYEVSLTLVGTREETVHVSDLYTQIAPIRYYIRLGGLGSYRHEVTDLRHIRSTTTVTTSLPASEIAMTTVILSPKAWAFGLTATPHYLR